MARFPRRYHWRTRDYTEDYSLCDEGEATHGSSEGNMGGGGESRLQYVGEALQKLELQQTCQKFLETDTYLTKE